MKVKSPTEKQLLPSTYNPKVVIAVHGKARFREVISTSFVQYATEPEPLDTLSK